MIQDEKSGSLTSNFLLLPRPIHRRVRGVYTLTHIHVCTPTPKDSNGHPEDPSPRMATLLLQHPSSLSHERRVPRGHPSTLTRCLVKFRPRLLNIQCHSVLPFPPQAFPKNSTSTVTVQSYDLGTSTTGVGRSGGRDGPTRDGARDVAPRVRKRPGRTFLPFCFSYTPRSLLRWNRAHIVSLSGVSLSCRPI